jgi:hypothetical protein
MKFLHYIDSPVKIPIRGGLEDLPERRELIDVFPLVLPITN